MDKKSIIGNRYGKWTVLSKNGDHHLCKCDCGTIRKVVTYNLTVEVTKSCGCASLIHGMRKSPEFIALREIKYRCNTPTAKAYKGYGGRGITVCKEWNESFLSFYNHIGPRPGPEYSVDRIDNNKGYQPGNVRWATRREQMNNRRGTVKIEFAGIIISQGDWARILGMKYKSLNAGLLLGIPIDYYVKKYILKSFSQKTFPSKKATYA